MAYIVGEREFWGLPFKVSPAVLVPRPDSETLIEAALVLMPDRQRPWRILDLGLGSGCLLLALLREYPAANGRPATIHDDLMIIYQEAGATKALYFDNENHVIHYDVSLSADKKKVVFLSEKTASAPQFRLTYEDAGPGTLKISFEIAPPDKPGQFSKYVEGTVHRQPPA